MIKFSTSKTSKAALLSVSLGAMLGACATPALEKASLAPTHRSADGARLLNEALASIEPTSFASLVEVMSEAQATYAPTTNEMSAEDRRYLPTLGAAAYQARGVASWYGDYFHGRKTASGEKFNMHAMTAAHPTLPLGSFVRVKNTRNGKSVVVKVNDRGPYHKGRLIDLSRAAAVKLDFVRRGSTPVQIERVEVRAPSADEQQNIARASVMSDSPMYLLLGSFNALDRAKNVLTRTQVLLRSKDYAAKQLDIIGEEGRFSVRLGPFSAPNRAHDVAKQLNIQTVLVQ